MPKKTLRELDSTLTPFPAAVATGDQVENLTTGLMTICIGVETVVGSAKVVLPKEGSEITVLPGKTSAAITIGTGEKAYLLNTEASMRSTVNKVIV